jgi:uncharacterized membrane protein (DUF485 family)
MARPLTPQDWRALETDPEFRALVAARRRFTIPAVIFFVVYYFALPISVGYFPDVMSRRAIGSVNLAYLFALSQFVMAWVLMWLYVRAARRFDAQAARIIAKIEG